jgi:hypothetical protein
LLKIPESTLIILSLLPPTSVVRLIRFSAAPPETYEMPSDVTFAIYLILFIPLDKTGLLFAALLNHLDNQLFRVWKGLFEEIFSLGIESNFGLNKMGDVLNVGTDLLIVGPSNNLPKLLILIVTPSSKILEHSCDELVVVVPFALFFLVNKAAPYIISANITKKKSNEKNVVNNALKKVNSILFIAAPLNTLSTMEKHPFTIA